MQKSEKGPFCHSELVEELRQIKQLEYPSSEEYLRVRRTRAGVSVICKQMLTVIDRIEKLRLEEP